MRALVLIANLVVALSVHAQEPAEPAVKPYDKRLMRLSEVLGSLHFLRPLCGREEEGDWRKAMGELIAIEKPSDERRARMVSRFSIFGVKTPTSFTS